MVRFERVSIAGIIDTASFEVRGGEVCKIITETDFGKNALLDCMAGLRKPDSGSLYISGEDIYMLPPSKAVLIYNEVSFIWKGGGLVSNLRLWENISLPMEYHNGVRPEEMEDRVLEYIEKLGPLGKRLSGRMNELPGHLPEHLRTLAGFIRALLVEPYLIIYDSILDGLSEGAADTLASLIREFHNEQVGRISIIVNSDERSLNRIDATKILRQKGESIEQAET